MTDFTRDPETVSIASIRIPLAHPSFEELSTSLPEHEFLNLGQGENKIVITDLQGISTSDYGVLNGILANLAQQLEDIASMLGESERVQRNDQFQNLLIQLRLKQELNSILQEAEYEEFENGQISALSGDLTALVNRFGNDTLEHLAQLLQSEQLSPEVAAETLRITGDMDHPPSREARRHLLEKNLTSALPRVRDGAASGLGYLDDPTALAALDKAIERETVNVVRKYMQQVREHLARNRD